MLFVFIAIFFLAIFYCFGVSNLISFNTVYCYFCNSSIPRLGLPMAILSVLRTLYLRSQWFYHNFPHINISAISIPFPVRCITCYNKHLKCKASSQPKGLCHYCYLNTLECYFPAAAAAMAAAAEALADLAATYPFQCNCFHCTHYGLFCMLRGNHPTGG
jgi:hypothetical protein